MTATVAGQSLFLRIGGRECLDTFLRRFYADVRQHRVIGPIFEKRIVDWPAHLQTIADFWSGATGGPVRYSGAMPAKHLLLGLEKAHFEIWLELWRRQCGARLGPVEAQELIGLAEGIGKRLRAIIASRG